MKQFLVCLICGLSCNLMYLQGQDSTTTTNQLTIKSSLGKADVSFEFDTINQDAIQETLVYLDSLYSGQVEQKIYGHNFFEQDSVEITESPVTRKVTDSYILDSGDEISISIFGISQFDGKFIINEAGFISPEQLPKILLKGMRWKEAKKILKRRFQNYFRFGADQFSAGVISPRTITVSLFGEVTKPGAYEVPATITAFSVLRRALGPTSIGSVRNIKIIDEEQTRILDLYELFNNPTKQYDLYLTDNTFIQIPTLEKTVRIKGAVKRPMHYELNSNEGLADLLKYAGGFAPNAVRGHIRLNRFIDEKLTLIDLDESDIENNFILEPGDVVTIRRLDRSQLDYNYIVVEGSITLPGKYSLNTTPTIRSLLERAGLKDQSRTDIAYIVRTNSNGRIKLIKISIDEILSDPNKDVVLQPRDRLVISDLTNFVDKFNISVEGSVREEISIPLDTDAKIYLSQVIFLAGGLNPDANGQGYIIRSSPKDLKDKSYVKVDINEALKNEFGEADIPLRPWDRVIVLAASTFTDEKKIAIRGSVRIPQPIPFDESLDLKDVITLSGGLTDRASRKITVTRINIEQDQPTENTSVSLELDENYNIIAGPKDFKLKPYDDIIVRDVAEFELQKFVEIKGEVINGGIYSLVTGTDKISDLLKKAGGPTSDAFLAGAKFYRFHESPDTTKTINTYRVITDLKDVMANPNSAYNYILKEHDVLIIPKKTNVVHINVSRTMASRFAASMSKPEIAVKYVPGKNAKWYIEEFAGGFSDDANKSSVTVEYANGAMKKSRKGIFKKYPVPEAGSTIFVGTKPMKNKNTSNDSMNSGLLKKGVIININEKTHDVQSQLIDPEGKME